jgi:hypothetical protein
LVSSSFLTDVSNFEEFHSDDDPLTSTPIKMPDEPREHTTSPLAPSFIRADQSSFADSVHEDDYSESQFADSDADTTSTPTSKTHDSTSKAQSVLASNPSTEMPATSASVGANHPFDVTKQPVDSANLHTASANNGTSSPQWYGYKVVGDNVDKKVKPRYMRSDNQSKDLHYFHLYALRDPIDHSEALEDPLNLNPDAALATLIPTSDDIKKMMSNFGVLIARQLIQYFPYFQRHFSDVAQQHIPHPHQAEMKEVSEVVSTDTGEQSPSVITSNLNFLSCLSYIPLNLIWDTGDTNNNT